MNRYSRAMIASLVALALVAGTAWAAAPAPMASGDILYASSTITSATDTTIVAAGGAGVVYDVLWLCVDVYAAGTTLRVEDALAGDVIFAADTSSTGHWCRTFSQQVAGGGSSMVTSYGYGMTANAIINVETVGTQSAAVTIAYRER